MCVPRLPLLAGLLLLAACGGGSGDSGNPAPPPPPPPPPSNTVTLTGVAEKGPFATGAQLAVSSLFPDGTTNAVVANSTISDDLGRFSVLVPPNQLLEISVNGTFGNELDGTTSMSPLTLKALLRVASNSAQSVNVNVLTHLAVPRARTLLAGGASAGVAETQSASDVLSALTQITSSPQLESFGALSLYSETQDDAASAYLVTVSALFAERARQLSIAKGSDFASELQGLLDRVAEDIGDGVVDNPAALIDLRDASYDINPGAITANLEEFANDAGSDLHPGNVLLFLDTDLDGELNNVDTDDDNDGIADVDDAYPLDWSCYLASHGNGTACTIGTAIPASYIPDVIDDNGAGIIYLLSAADNRVFRWSIDAQRYGFPVELPAGATSMAWSAAHGRLYVGFESGQIVAIDADGAHEQVNFAVAGDPVRKLVDAGNFLLAIDETETGYTYSNDGSLNDQHSISSTSPAYVWSGATNRVYHFGTTFPNSIRYQQINPQSGAFLGFGESAYSGDFSVIPPLRLSTDGTRLITGAGDTYAADTLEWQRSLPGDFADIAWLADDTTVDIRVDPSGTRLEHRSARGAVNEYGWFAGTPLRVIAHHARFQVIAQEDRPVFHLFRRGGDVDDDGVPNTADRFPMDAAASIDSDGDGHPDDWNSGRSAIDSTTGLTRDAYPDDSACDLAAHGNGAVCDVGGSIPEYLPDWTASDARDVVYLLNIERRRIYRWDPVAGHMNPLPVGYGETDTPVFMRYSPEFDRLYLGYDSGKLTYFDAADPREEQYFAATATEPLGMQPAGNFLWIAGTGAEAGINYALTFNTDGEVADRHTFFSEFSRHSAWNGVLSRVYLFRESGGPGDILYQPVNQSNGSVGDAVDSPYHGDYEILPPIRIAPDGSRVLLGSGHFYNADDLTWAAAIPGGFADAQYDGDRIVTARASADGAQVVLRDISGQVVDAAQFTGAPLSVLPSGDGFVVVTDEGGPAFHHYTPSDDADGDGVANPDDDFPLDPAASLDSDRDGYPDEWHTGMSEADSTTGLALDAYPEDSACYLPEHGDGTACDIAAQVPEYLPATIAIDDVGIIYLFSPENQRIFRWDTATQEHLNPFVLGSNPWLGVSTPTVMRHHKSHNRLYVGYDNGDLTFIDLASGPGEQYLTTMAHPVNGLADPGNFVLVQDDNTGFVSYHILDADGLLRDRSDFNSVSRDYQWDPVLNRLYYFRELGPGDLLFSEINQSSGLITAQGETPYHGDYDIEPPIRVSYDGSHVLLGSGDIYGSSDMTWRESMPGGIIDANWSAAGEIVSIGTDGSDARLERRSNAGVLVETGQFDGEPLAIFPVGSSYVVVTNQGRPVFHPYLPSDDSDGDGVANDADAFPLDRAASVDSDGDGYPDAWNAGMSEADSTTGLALDAYPDDTVCYLAEHGDGSLCDITATMPDFVPSTIAFDDAGIVYLLSPENQRIYRWDSTNEEYISAYTVGINRWLNHSTPYVMAYHAAHQRLYLGYDNGDINFVDLAAGSAELHLATIPRAVGGLADAGNFLLAQDNRDVSSYVSHYFFEADGTLRNSDASRSYSREYAWNPMLNRLYFSGDSTYPSNLIYEEIDPATAAVLASAETPYWEFLVDPPIRLSPNGGEVLVGTGHIFDAGNLDWIAWIPGGYVDARWRDDDGIVVVRDDSGNARIERRDSSHNIVEFAEFTGVPLALLPSGPSYLVITDQGRPGFHWYVPNDDSDGDGIDNPVDAFPSDVAASVDSDGDGHPDAWNAGMSEADSTTGLTIDAYPDDSACFLPSHGDGINCDVTSTLPDYLPSGIDIDAAGVVHLFSPENQRIYRWDAVAQSHMNPLVAGASPWLGSAMSTVGIHHPTHQRLYMGYANGDITFIDLAGASSEQLLTRLPAPIRGLADAGNFLLTQDERNNGSDTVFDASGVQRYSESNTQLSDTYEWSPALGRVYLFRDHVIPNDIRFRSVDQSSGFLGIPVESPYHGNYEIEPPIRVSPNGSRVLLGTGDIYDANSLAWLDRIPGGFADARWTDDGGTVVLESNAAGAQLVRRDGSGDVAEVAQFVGEPLVLLPFGSSFVVVTNIGGPAFFVYVPNDDADGDGVPNTQDAFPYDVAASVDTDGDGYPDAWNPGMSGANSTTGLVLDAYPNDFACYLPEHGDGVNCDPSSTIPDYVPTSVTIDDAGIVYLFSRENRRVYRWDALAREHLNPYVVGAEIEVGGTVPRHMVYQSNQFRLYFGYDNGDITYIDLAAETAEQDFVTMPAAILNLGDAGNFLFTYTGTSGGTTSVFDSGGAFLASTRPVRRSERFVWNPVLERMYFLRDSVSPNDIHYLAVDQTTGALGPVVDSPYNGGYQIMHPIRISTDGGKVLVGGGDVFDANNLTWLATISTTVTDAVWLLNGRIATIRPDDVNTRFEIFSSSYVSQLTQSISNPPIALFRYNNEVIVVTQGATPAFTVLTP